MDKRKVRKKYFSHPDGRDMILTSGTPDEGKIDTSAMEEILKGQGFAEVMKASEVSETKNMLDPRN